MRVLVAGIGNIFMGDDGFGCEVAQKLSRMPLPEGVDVVDFGIRGMDLSYALTEGYELAILVDAMQRGTDPGTLSVIEPEMEAPKTGVVESGEHLIAPHAMDPVKVLKFVATLGERRPRMLLVACEPACLGGENGHMGLSEAVDGAVGKAVDEIQGRIGQPSCGDTFAHRVDGLHESQLRSESTPGGLS